MIRQGETHDMQEGMEIERIARLLKVSEDDVRNWIEENRLLVKLFLRVQLMQRCSL